MLSNCYFLFELLFVYVCGERGVFVKGGNVGCGYDGVDHCGYDGGNGYGGVGGCFFLISYDYKGSV